MIVAMAIEDGCIVQDSELAAANRASRRLHTARTIASPLRLRRGYERDNCDVVLTNALGKQMNPASRLIRAFRPLADA